MRYWELFILLLAGRKDAFKPSARAALAGKLVRGPTACPSGLLLSLLLAPYPPLRL